VRRRGTSAAGIGILATGGSPIAMSSRAQTRAQYQQDKKMNVVQAMVNIDQPIGCRSALTWMTGGW
jgi:hypothetical protein